MERASTWHGVQQVNVMSRYGIHATGWLISLAAILTAGCQAPPESVGPTVERVQVATIEDRERLWEAAGDSLRAHYYRLDRQDRVLGVITTMPETTAQTLELWRPQPQPKYYWLEANLHTIRTQATVNLPSTLIEEAPEPGQPIEVLVERYRYRLPERQIDNPAAAMRIFSDEAPLVTSGQMESPAATGRWILLGRDEAMERRLITDILNRYGQPATRESTSPQDD
jgi:hypothetical protein